GRRRYGLRTMYETVKESYDEKIYRLEKESERSEFFKQGREDPAKIILPVRRQIAARPLYLKDGFFLHPAAFRPDVAQLFRECFRERQRASRILNFSLICWHWDDLTGNTSYNRRDSDSYYIARRRSF